MNKFIQKNFKWKNCQKRQRNYNKTEYSYITPFFGKYGVKACANFLITPEQLEMSRRVIVRTLNKKTQFWINIKCNTPLTKKPVGVRMGKGKGKFEQWVFPIKKGRILFEFEDININLLKKCFKTLSKRLPVRMKLVKFHL